MTLFLGRVCMARFQTLKICLSMLSLFNKYMKSMSEILAVDELYFTAAYPDLHIWSICILGSQTCYPGREEIASTLACACFVGLVEALPAWRSRGIFCFFCLNSRSANSKSVESAVDHCWTQMTEGFWTSALQLCQFLILCRKIFLPVVSFLLVVSFARCLVRRRSTIKFHDWSVLFDSNDMFPFAFTSLDGQQKDHLNHNGQFASFCFLQLMHGMVSTSSSDPKKDLNMSRVNSVKPPLQKKTSIDLSETRKSHHFSARLPATHW